MTNQEQNVAKAWATSLGFAPAAFIEFMAETKTTSGDIAQMIVDGGTSLAQAAFFKWLSA